MPIFVVLHYWGGEIRVDSSFSNEKEAQAYCTKANDEGPGQYWYDSAWLEAE